MPDNAQPPITAADVRAVYSRFPEPARDALLAIRALIFEVAGDDARIGTIEETLKWGQPSYLTPNTKSGSTIRLWVPKTGGYGVFTHCQSRLIEMYQSQAGAGLRFDGNRGVLFDETDTPPLDQLRPLIQSALTYRLH